MVWSRFSSLSDSATQPSASDPEQNANTIVLFSMFPPERLIRGSTGHPIESQQDKVHTPARRPEDTLQRRIRSLWVKSGRTRSRPRNGTDSQYRQPLKAG